MANMQFIQFNSHRRRVFIIHKFTTWLEIKYRDTTTKNTAHKIALKLKQRLSRYLSGAIGEERVLGLHQAQPGSLIELPDCYTVFNQVVIQYGKAIREMDYIVIGPNGIFIIEVKNNKGTITGSESDETWEQSFDDPVSTTRRIRNPVKQVKSTLYVFKQFLKEQGVSPWLNPIVIYSHPSCTLVNDDCSIPVLRLSELTNYILTFRAEQNTYHIENTFKLLVRLQSMDNIYSPDAIKRIIKKTKNSPRKNKPVPVSYFMHDIITNRVNDIMNHKRPIIEHDSATINEKIIDKDKPHIKPDNINEPVNIKTVSVDNKRPYEFDSDTDSILDDLFSLHSHIFNDDYKTHETTNNPNDLYDSFSMNTCHLACSNDINPASGLPMTDDFDTNGNIFGADSSSYDYSYDNDIFNTDDFNQI